MERSGRMASFRSVDQSGVRVGFYESSKLNPASYTSHTFRLDLIEVVTPFAQPNWVYHHQAINDPYYNDGSLWGLYGADTTPDANLFGIAASTGWDGVNNSETVYIGVVDEGIQYNHPDLAANIWTNPGEISGDQIDNDTNGYLNDIYGWNAIGNNGTIYNATYDDHGTHVAGTIGAAANSTGIIGVTGNRNAKFISGKFLGPIDGTTIDAIQIIDYMIALKTHNGLNIVALNNSWGGGGSDPELFAAIVRAANEDILFVVASGNDGLDTTATPTYPACYNTTVRPPGAPPSTEVASYNSVISVTAIDQYGMIPSWANFGANTIDLGAPGVNILSTLNRSKYGYKSGTSMATPHVSGAIALYKSHYPNATADQIRTALLSSTTPTPSLVGKTITGGRLNMETFLLPPPTALPNAPVMLEVTGFTSTSASLSWDDKSDNESSFKITRSVGSVDTILNLGPNRTSYTDVGLIPGTHYTYSIEACNIIGCTAAAADATAYTTPIPRATAIIKPADTTTKGSWVGNYGGQGYDMIAYKSIPASMSVASTGVINIWAATTTDVRDLQTPDKSSRTARCYYANPPYTPGAFFTIDASSAESVGERRLW